MSVSRPLYALHLRSMFGTSVPCPLFVRVRRYLCVSPPLASGTRPLPLPPFCPFHVRSLSGRDSGVPNINGNATDS